MEGRIIAEWEPLRKAVVHKPGIEMFFGLLDPGASLYERAFNQTAATEEHEKLVSALRGQFGVKAIGLLETIAHYVEKDKKAKVALVDTALSHIVFRGDRRNVEAAKRELMSNIDAYDPYFFLNIILLMPRMVLKKGRGISAIHINVIERNPLANLYFMRDQKAVTDKGVFLSRMSKPQRRHEPGFTRLLWEMMHLKIAHKTSSPGTFEGGDFMPMKEFALIGTGDRTNLSGVEQMLKHGQSFPEVGVVHQPSHPLIPSNKPDPMIDMHLDTYFNVAGSDVVIGSEMLLKRAAVDVYFKEGASYRKARKATNLLDYIKGKGFGIINLSTLEQLSYASNFLCIRDHKILAVKSNLIVKSVLKNLNFKAKLDRKRYGALLSQAKKDYQKFLISGQLFPRKREMCENGIDLYAVDLKNITGGYGGAHCMTVAIER